MIHEYAYAKINLGLEVGPVRNDKYHEMSTLMVPINLYDELYFEKTNNGVLLLDNTDIKMEENFVYKAAKLFIETFDIKEGVRIRLIKNIPSEAGLGGGSADAAATLRGLNRLFELNKSLDELYELAKSLGSDMPFCLYNKLAVCTGRGEEVHIIDKDYKKLPVAIIKPPYGLSTKEVYQNTTKFEINQNEDKYNNIIDALANADYKLLENNLFNALSPAAFKLIPDLETLAVDIKEMGFICEMSGSGTSLFAFSKVEKFDILKEKLKFYNVIITQLL